MGRRLKANQLYVLAVIKAKQHPVLHQLKHSSRSKEAGIPFYLPLIRSNLEYGIPFLIVSVWEKCR